MPVYLHVPVYSTSHVPVSSSSVLRLALSLSLVHSVSLVLHASISLSRLPCLAVTTSAVLLGICECRTGVNPRLLRSVPGRADEQYELQLRDAESMQLELVFAQPPGARIFAMAVVGDGATPLGPLELWACVGTEVVLWGRFDSL